MLRDRSYTSQKDITNNSMISEKNPFPIKFSGSSRVQDVLKSTKSLIKDTDRYENFIIKYKIKNNPNLSNSVESFHLPGVTQFGFSGNTEKSEFYAKHRSEFANSNYFKLSTSANTFQLSNKKNNFSKDKINPNDVLKKSLYGNTTLNILPNIQTKRLEKISYTNILPDLNVCFDIFKNINYENKRYDVNKIFNNDHEYFDMLRIKIEEMKSSSKFEIEEKGCLVKKYHEKNKIMTMILNSITIEFIFPSGSFKEPILHYLPLCLLPLFYFNPPDDIKFLFMSLIEFNEDYDEIKLDFQKMYNFVVFSDKYDTQKIDVLQFSKGIFFLNIYYFKWITPKYQFDIKIRLPEIKLISEENKIYCKFADPSIMLHIIKQEYVNWDFYCLNYLISDKEFRKTLNLIFSKEHQLKNMKNSFFMSEVDVNKPVFSNDKNYKFSLEETKLSIFITNEKNENYVNTFLPYKVLINHSKIKVKEPFILDFNFKEMITLGKIYLKWNLPKFLKKILNINFKRKYINIDKEYLSKIDDNFLNFTIQYDEIVEAENQHIFLNILKPRILLESINGTEYIKYDYDIIDEILGLLIRSDHSDWLDILLRKKCFMKSKKSKNLTKLATNFKKVANLTGMIGDNNKKYRINSGKNFKDSNPKNIDRKFSIKRRTTINLGNVDYECLKKKLTNKILQD